MLKSINLTKKFISSNIRGQEAISNRLNKMGNNNSEFKNHQLKKLNFEENGNSLSNLKAGAFPSSVK